jgi:hypothetical protein
MFKTSHPEFYTTDIINFEKWIGDRPNFVIDPFIDFDGFKNSEENFDYNTKKYKDKIIKIKGYSQIELRKIDGSFDFIYIDGSHTSWDTLEDLILSFRILKHNGIIICDDYEWYKQDLYGPKPGIDAFLNIFINSYDLLFKEYQVGIKKR